MSVQPPHAALEAVTLRTRALRWYRPSRPSPCSTNMQPGQWQCHLKTEALPPLHRAGQFAAWRVAVYEERSRKSPQLSEPPALRHSAPCGSVPVGHGGRRGPRHAALYVPYCIDSADGTCHHVRKCRQGQPCALLLLARSRCARAAKAERTSCWAPAARRRAASERAARRSTLIGARCDDTVSERWPSPAHDALRGLQASAVHAGFACHTTGDLKPALCTAASRAHACIYRPRAPSAQLSSGQSAGQTGATRAQTSCARAGCAPGVRLRMILRSN